jgi:hypothetical protein
VRVFVPVPAVEGVKTLVDELTPGPEYVPPNGIPPFNFMGFAFSVVTLSKQRVKVTTGTGEETMMILLDVAGLPETHDRFEVMTHQTLSFG